MRVRNRLRYIEIGVIAIILMILVTKLTTQSVMIKIRI